MRRGLRSEKSGPDQTRTDPLALARGTAPATSTRSAFRPPLPREDLPRQAEPGVLKAIRPSADLNDVFVREVRDTLADFRKCFAGFYGATHHYDECDEAILKKIQFHLYMRGGSPPRWAVLHNKQPPLPRAGRGDRRERQLQPHPVPQARAPPLPAPRRRHARRPDRARPGRRAGRHDVIPGDPHMAMKTYSAKDVARRERTARSRRDDVVPARSTEELCPARTSMPLHAYRSVVRSRP